MRSAVAARGDSDIVVLGRTSAASVTSVDDAVARLRAYEAAGVDGLMIPGLKSRAELDAIAAQVRLPLVLGGPAQALADPAYLASRNARLWNSGHQTFNVAVQALHDAMKAVRDGMPGPALPGAASAELMGIATGAAEYRDAARAYLGAR